MAAFVTFDQAVEQREWLTERYLRRLVAERRVSFAKVGGKLVFDLDDLDALIADNRVPTAAERADTHRGASTAGDSRRRRVKAPAR